MRRIAEVRASPEGKEGVAAFLGKRAAAWVPPELRTQVSPCERARIFDTWQLVALAGALGWASGLRLYAVLFIVGASGFLHWIDLPAGLSVLAHPLVLAASGFMCFVEFFADKIPGVDSAWDVVQTFIRIPAGAALAASVFGDASTATMLAAAIVGGTLAAGSHLAKAGSRAVINTSPEPFSNWAASFGEELAVGTVLWLAFAHPVAALVVLAVLVALTIWLFPKVWRLVRAGVESRLAALVRRHARAADAVMRSPCPCPAEDASPWMRAPRVRAAGGDAPDRREPDAPARAGAARADYVVMIHRCREVLSRAAAPKALFTASAGVAPRARACPASSPACPSSASRTPGWRRRWRATCWPPPLRVAGHGDVYRAQQRQGAWTQVPATRSRVVRGGGAGTRSHRHRGRARAGGSRASRCAGTHADAGRSHGVACYAGDDELPAFLAGLDLLVSVLPHTASPRSTCSTTRRSRA